MHASRQWILSGLLAAALVVPARAAELDRYVPADAEQVIIVNVKQLLDAPLVKKHALPQIEQQIKNNKELQKVMAVTGLDPLKDVDTLVISNTGDKGEKVTFIVHGKFDVEKIHTVAQAVAKDKPNELKISKLGDRTLYEGSHDGKSIYSTFVDGKTLVGSTSKDVLSSAIEGKGGKNKELTAALKKLDDKLKADSKNEDDLDKQSFYTVGLVPEEVRNFLGGLNQGPAEALSKLKSVASSIKISKGLSAGVRLSTGNKKAADEIAEFGDMAKGLLAAAAAVNKDLVPLAQELQKTLNVKSSDGDVTIDFSVSGEVIDKLAKLAPGGGRKPRQPKPDQ